MMRPINPVRLPVWALLALALVAGACATTRPPEAEMAEARSAVAQAEQVGAGEHAALELRSAAQKLEQAEAELADGDYEDARLLAEKAEIDAELAEVTALSAKAQAAVRELRESIRALRDEIERNQRGNRR